MTFKSISTLIESSITEKIFPGAVVAILENDTVTYFSAFGYRSIKPKRARMCHDTLFDVASLTKPIVIGTLAMQLVEKNMLSLDTPVQTYLPTFGHVHITCRQLLTHTSGLPAWKPVYLLANSPAEAVEVIGEMPLESPPGKKVTYSCLGYIVMGTLIAKCIGEPLDSLANRCIFEPLGMNRTCYNPSPDLQPYCAATEDSNSFERRMVSSDGGDRHYAHHNWRDGVILGEVHDENAHFLGGVSGNAGLFSNAADLLLFCKTLLQGGGMLLHADSVKTLATPQTPATETERRSIGWHILADGSLYHTGFTGTSIRLNLQRRLAAILLTNRVHPDAQRPGIIACRNQFHRIIFG